MYALGIKGCHKNQLGSLAREEALPWTHRCNKLSDPVDCSPPGSSVHGILQARILSTGTILSSLSFDREQQSTYTFQLKAVDGGVPPRSAYVGVTINVLDENDNAPFITAPSNTSHRLLTPQTRLGETVSQVPEHLNAVMLHGMSDF